MVCIETLRYFERDGIVPRPIPALNNCRLYSASDVGMLRFFEEIPQPGVSSIRR
ncbi:MULTISPECIES: MerR family transcriptional regulator [Ruegeria]|uniref:MerR family transcriptional regulator n=1 Tax=Ruegeria TaxID=97050 RepID=UPI003464047A